MFVGIQGLGQGMRRNNSCNGPARTQSSPGDNTNPLAASCKSTNTNFFSILSTLYVRELYYIGDALMVELRSQAGM